MNRIFIVGCARSGTTLLQSMLASHPQLVGFTESHFFDKNFHNLLTNDKVYLPKMELKNNIVKFFYDNNIDEDLIKQIQENRKLRTAGSWTKDFIHVLDQYSERNNFEGWIEKTPPHLHHLNFINNMVQNVKFIHILRDGKNVVASMHEVANKHPEVWGKRTLEDCVERWNNDLQISLEWIRNKDNHIGIRYEELLESPEYILNILCNFIGIEYDSHMLNYRNATKDLVRKHEVWKSENFSSMKKTNRYDKLSNDKKQYIESNLNFKEYYKYPYLLK
ncbi:sulfotransferase [Virgibacillus sp. MSP4-1]|uniref:sulfotransferase family protein n=1 Tax=Virgibacillus sp. MSP4-1 TaxID=2700081 RepID=UPI00039F7F3E|nr:sulfotransferase [Virgibacillus sp. MSP4-1]QHS23488.1 sulfotransferase [Virgibacillus sp. MSP4-1]